MRCLIKAKLPTEQGNQVISEGRLGQVIQSILGELKPEAAYFTAEGGQRTAYIFADIPDPSAIPGLIEPFFLAFNASVEISPAMTAEDLGRAGPAIERAVQVYGHSRQPAGSR